MVKCHLYASSIAWQTCLKVVIQWQHASRYIVKGIVGDLVRLWQVRSFFFWMFWAFVLAWNIRSGDMFVFLEYSYIHLEALDTLLHDYGAIVLAGERCGVELGLCKRIYSLCILV